MAKTERTDLSCCVAELKSNWLVVNANNNYHTYTHSIPSLQQLNCRPRSFQGQPRLLILVPIESAYSIGPSDQ